MTHFSLTVGPWRRGSLEQLHAWRTQPNQKWGRKAQHPLLLPAYLSSAGGPSRQLPRTPVRFSAKWSASGTHRVAEIVQEWLWHRINKEELEIVQTISSQRSMKCPSNSKTGQNYVCPLGGVLKRK